MSEDIKGEKPIARTLCGFCNTGDHTRCRERNGWVPFSHGLHQGNQCRCHDVGHTVNLKAQRVTESSAMKKRGRTAKN